MTGTKRTNFIDMSAFGEGFDRALSKLMRDKMEELRANYINPSNVERYHHGRAWKGLDLGSQTPSESEIVTHQHETSIPFERVVAHDLNMIADHIHEVTSAMHQQFQKHLFESIEAATSRTGNVVSAAEVGGPAEAFLETLKKIEFGVDEDGQVSRPSFHVGKEGYERMKAAVEAKGPEFAAKIQHVTQEKETQALEKEKARKAKFAIYHD